MSFELTDEQRTKIEVAIRNEFDYDALDLTMVKAVIGTIIELTPSLIEEGRKQGLEEADNLFNVYSGVKTLREAIRALKEKPYLDVMDEIEIDAAIAQEKP